MSEKLEFIGPIQQEKFEIISCKRMKIDANGLDKFGWPWGIGSKAYVVSVQKCGILLQNTENQPNLQSMQKRLFKPKYKNCLLGC